REEAGLSDVLAAGKYRTGLWRSNDRPARRGGGAVALLYFRRLDFCGPPGSGRELVPAARSSRWSVSRRGILVPAQRRAAPGPLVDEPGPGDGPGGRRNCLLTDKSGMARRGQAADDRGAVAAR